MAPHDDTIPETRFDTFHVYQTHFKQIGDHKIKVGILVPKDLKPGKVPIAVKFHGGALIVGDALLPDWIASYWIPFMHRNNSITVLPNYRLTPEATGEDILEDLQDFWTWFHNHGVDKFLASQNVKPDLDYEHLLVSGESAGGYMALQSGLTRPKGEIKVLLAQYPMTTCLRQKPDDIVFGFPVQPNEWLDDYIAQIIKPGAVTSSAHPFTSGRGPLASALVAHGRFEEFFGVGKHLWPVTAIESASYLPPTTIFHAAGDSVVKFQDSVKFVNKASIMLPGSEIRLAYGKEGDHAFDITFKEDEHEWLRTELEWVERKWLA